MKKTSRRNFAKSIATALAATPLLVSKTAATQRKANDTKVSPFDIRTHDTPPPLEVIDGSLRIESHDDHTEKHDQVKNRWYYDNPAYPNMAHIKVLHGSGDLIYRNLEADGLTVAITLTGSAGDLIMAGGITNDMGVKVFRMSSDKKMPHSNSNKPEKRPYKFDHPGNAGNFWIQKITISDATGILFQVTAKTPPEEYKVMIWNEGDRPPSK